MLTNMALTAKSWALNTRLLEPDFVLYARTVPSPEPVKTKTWINTLVVFNCRFCPIHKTFDYTTSKVPAYLIRRRHTNSLQCVCGLYKYASSLQIQQPNIEQCSPNPMKTASCLVPEEQL